MTPPDPKKIRDDLRAFLNRDDVSLADVERKTGLNRSWLSKFRRGEWDNVTIDNLSEVHAYQVRWQAEQPRARK